ncbi:putative leucine aminopeptidase 2 [Neonectria ditissima]|uniref:Peptide hydrolase n=1 Tax=Neonectria ditissima TaxID=78410 RepID=A0A0P7BNV3_9HYPO|nr:putative leucine aminopeptidase 2 [Neonectria ditissima]
MRTSAIALLALAVPALAAGSSKPKPKKYVTSDKLQKLIKLDDLVAGSQKLQDIADAHGGNRAFGSGGHNATVDYLYDTLTALGYYDVVKQPFTELFASGTAVVTVNGDDVDAGIMTYTPGGSASGALVAVPNLGCDVADYPAAVEGNVALVSRGTCTFAQKSINAKEAGATGIIVYNNVPGELSGTLGEPFGNYVPIVGISQEDGAAILELIAAGDVTVELEVDAVVEERVTFNVIAETKGGNHDNVLVLGGHSDSVAAGPGINDDGSGTIGVLNVAVALANFKVKNAVRFAFWSAEEFGLLGSYAYIKSINSSSTELSKIRAYLNFDMIASPNYVYGIYDGDGSAFNLTGPAGSDVLEQDFEKFYEKKKTPHVPSEFSGRSDYAAFIENGIPSGGLFTGAEVLKTEEEAALFGGEAGVAYDVNYHKAGDDINNLALDAYLLNTQSIANSVAKYAKSFRSLKPVNKEHRRWAAERADFFKRSRLSSHTHEEAGPCGGGPSI